MNFYAFLFYSSGHLINCLVPLYGSDGFPHSQFLDCFFLQIGEQKSNIKMCRKSIFDDSFCVKVPPNVFHFAKCWFIRPVSVNSITSCDLTPRGHIPMSFMVADHRLVCIRKTLGTVFPLQLSIVEHMFIV